MTAPPWSGAYLLPALVALLIGCDPVLFTKVVRGEGNRLSLCVYDSAKRDALQASTLTEVGVTRLDGVITDRLVWSIRGPFTAACVEYGAPQPKPQVIQACQAADAAPPLEPNRCYLFWAKSPDTIGGSSVFCLDSSGRPQEHPTPRPAAAP